MGNTCCNYAPKDPNALSVPGAGGTIKMQQSPKAVTVDLTPEVKEMLAKAAPHEPKVIKI